MPADAVPQPRISFRAAVRLWLKIGCLSFGGPAGQIAMMHAELVDRRHWIDEPAFLRGLNFCSLLPGPEAQQLATYIGWRLHGTKGGIAAGTLFVVPGALVMLVLSWLAATQANQPWLAAVFDGLKPVVVAIIVVAVWRLARRAFAGWPSLAMAAAAFVALYFLGVGFPWVVFGAALIGWVAGRRRWQAFQVPAHGGGAAAQSAMPAAVPIARPIRRLGALIAAFGMLWALPLLAIVAVFGSEPFIDIAVLFTKAAFVTFGGAYAVLPYIADQAVNHYEWLSRGEMLNGLALAETTPGPLILVLQYVGFFAGWQAAAGDLAVAATAAALTTYVTFLPSFLFIFAGAPYLERLTAMPSLASALSAVNAAIVGVILNLAAFFATPVFFPDGGGISGFAVVLSTLTAAVLLRFSPGLHWLIAAGAVAGLLRWALT
jgi:chromate transporter